VSYKGVTVKTLLILRHGKAQEDAPKGDKARKLVERGVSDSALMGKLIKDMDLEIDGIVSSDAARAKQTAEIAAEAAHFDGKIEYDPDIYYSGLDALLKAVRELPDKWDRVLLVGHNPGFEELSAALAVEGTEPPSLSTAGLAWLVFEDAKKWKDVKEDSGKLRGVYRPKDYRDGGS
jgi:phosphohistidine phosphatase